MDAFFAFLFVPTILICVVVIPTALKYYYQDRERMSRSLSSEEWEEIRVTLERADKMEQRITTLESLLDAQDPSWKDKV